MCAGNAFTNFLLAGSLNQVWGMINNLQIVIHSPLINVQFPGNAFILYDNMIVVATFDFLPTDDWYPFLFPNVPQDIPFNEKFERLNYDSNVLLFLMGTLLLVFFYYIFCFIMAYPIYFLHTEAKCARTLYYRWIVPTCFWNGTIRFV